MADEEVSFTIVQQPVAYEGAATSYKSGLNGLLAGSHDSLAVRELLYLQMRVEHAIRNNGYAKTAFNKYITNLGAIKVIWKDESGKRHRLMQSLWDEFILNPSFDNVGNFSQIQAIWNGACFRTGASHTRILFQKRNNSNRVPLKLQTIPTHLHDISYTQNYPAEKNIFYGIKFQNNVPKSYFYRQGLWEQMFLGIDNVEKHIEIPAEEIVHIFYREVPAQWLGIPRLACVLILLYELDELTDATVAKQKAAQAVSWIVRNSNPTSAFAPGVAVQAKDADGNKKIVFNSSGGNVQYLNKGEDIAFYQSTDIGANLQTLINSELRRISSAADVPYFQLTQDYSGIDFSTLRGILIELRSRIEFIHHFYTIPMGVLPVANKFKEYARLYNRKVDKAYPSFQLPRWYGIDDLKDVQADLLEVQSGMATLESKLNERHTSFEEIVEDRKNIKENGLDSILQNINSSNQTKQSKNFNSNANSAGN